MQMCDTEVDFDNHSSFGGPCAPSQSNSSDLEAERNSPHTPTGPPSETRPSIFSILLYYHKSPNKYTSYLSVHSVEQPHCSHCSSHARGNHHTNLLNLSKPIHLALESARWHLRSRCSKGRTFSPTSSNTILTASHGCISRATINMLSKQQLPPPLQLNNSTTIGLRRIITLLGPRLHQRMARTQVLWIMSLRRIGGRWRLLRIC